MLYVLHPIPVAVEFTLDEALHWVAYKQYATAHPIIDYIFNDEEKWDDIDEMFGRNTERRKIDKPGTKELFFQNNNLEKLELQKRGLIYPNKPEFAAAPEERIRRGYQHYEEVELVKNVCLDPYKAELLLKLQEGKLSAFGKVRGTLKKGVSESKWKEKNSWQKTKYEREDFEKDVKNSIISGKPVNWFQKIPPEFWYSEGINWQENSARSRMGWFHLIFIRAEHLISVFPHPEGKPIIIEERAGYLIYDDKKEGADSIEQIKARRGRPPSYKWPEFHAEILRYALESGGLPKKQMALEQHMQTWCTEHWGITPGHATLHEQISPNYARMKKVKNSA